MLTGLPTSHQRWRVSTRTGPRPALIVPKLCPMSVLQRDTFDSRRTISHVMSSAWGFVEDWGREGGEKEREAEGGDATQKYWELSGALIMLNAGSVLCFTPSTGFRPQTQARREE